MGNKSVKIRKIRVIRVLFLGLKGRKVGGLEGWENYK